MTAAVNQRYTAVAITLHWLIAAAIVGMILLGWYMTALPHGEQQFALYQLHKSIGVTILLLSLARVIWRLMNPPPPEPPMPGWQAALATTVHIALYAFMIIMPITGWVMVSASTSGVATTLFRTVPWPHVPGFEGLDHDTREGIEGQLGWVHSKLAWVAIGLLALHVAGALKHQFIDKDGLLARMAPGLFGSTSGPPSKGRGALWAFGASLLVFTAATGFAMAQRAPAAAPATTTAATPPPASTEPVSSTATADPPPTVTQTAAPPATKPTTTAAKPETTQAPPTGPAKAVSSAWTVDAAKSSLAFKGGYMGRPFQGKFKDWSASIQFDPAKPDDARIRVTVKMNSAATGEPYYDDNVKEGDWFNSGKFPEAVYTVANGVRRTDDTHFEANGVLNLKGTDYPLKLPFTLKIEGDTATMHSEIAMSRTGLTIGKDTLTAAKGSEEWVADEVKLVVDVVAQRQ